MAELGLSEWRSREFWGMLLMFIIVFFIRMYNHYIGQWMFLNAISIPVNKWVRQFVYHQLIKNAGLSSNYPDPHKSFRYDFWSLNVEISFFLPPTSLYGAWNIHQNIRPADILVNTPAQNHINSFHFIIHTTSISTFSITLSLSIHRFNFLPYTVELNYQSTLMATREEIGVVWLGPLTNIIVFSLLVVFCWVCQKLFGFFPDIGCKFIVAYGLFTFLDPILILIVDMSLKVWKDVNINKCTFNMLIEKNIHSLILV